METKILISVFAVAFAGAFLGNFFAHRWIIWEEIQPHPSAPQARHEVVVDYRREFEYEVDALKFCRDVQLSIQGHHYAELREAVKVRRLGKQS